MKFFGIRHLLFAYNQNIVVKIPTVVYMRPRINTRSFQFFEMNHNEKLPSMVIKKLIKDDADPVSLSCCSNIKFMLGGRTIVKLSVPIATDTINKYGLSLPIVMTSKPETIVKIKHSEMIVIGLISLERRIYDKEPKTLITAFPAKKNENACSERPKRLIKMKLEIPIKAIIPRGAMENKITRRVNDGFLRTTNNLSIEIGTLSVERSKWVSLNMIPKTRVMSPIIINKTNSPRHEVKLRICAPITGAMMGIEPDIAPRMANAFSFFSVGKKSLIIDAEIVIPDPHPIA